MSADLAHATKQSTGTTLSVEPTGPMARARMQASVPITARSQARTLFLWVIFLATAVVILLAWRTGAEPVKRATLMPPGWGMGLRVIELPGGARLEAPRRGFIDSLVTALTSHDAPDDGPFVFDRVDSTPGSAPLPAAAQLEQLVTVLKAFPSVTISVEGHTDNVGDAGANTKLSARRAAAVKAELVGMGVAGGRITTVGYGQSRPIAGNGSEEGRARNRRMQITLTQR